MRKSILMLLVTLLAGFVLPSYAQQVGLAAIPAVVSLPQGEYEPILTPENLAEHATFIHAKGGSAESWAQMFKDEGILFIAYDDSNQRALVMSALADADGQRFIDIDQQTPDVRADYRRAHLDAEGTWAALGYRMESAEWKNFPSVGRFLMLKYRYSPGGNLAWRGFARRSVKNGLTITLDMRVYGRALKGIDNNKLNEVFDTLAFTAASAPGITLPVVLSESKIPPAETNEAAFTMEGTGRPGISVNVVVGAFSGGNAEVFKALTDAKGRYSIPITLPREDFFNITLTAAMEGMTPYERNYPVQYGKMLIPVNFTSPSPPDTLTADSYTISGTTLSATDVQLLVNNDQVNQVRTNRSGAFSLKVDTKAEGPYAIRLTFSKNNFNVRTIDFNTRRGNAAAVVSVISTPAIDAGTLVPAPESTLDALSPNYTDLIARAAEYDTKQLTYDGFLMKTEQQGGDWLLHMALRKNAAGYADTIILVSDRDPAIRIDSPIRVVGELVGISQGEGSVPGYPRLQLTSIQAFPSDSAPTLQP